MNPLDRRNRLPEEESELNQKRLGRRFKTRFETLYDGEPTSGSGVLTDISLTGAFIEDAATRPRLGTLLRLRVLIEPGRELLEVLGAVVRYTERGFAVRYDKPHPEIYELLDDGVAVRSAITPQQPSGEKKNPSGASLRDVFARFYSSGSWNSGHLSLPARRSLLDHLDQQESFLTIRHAQTSAGRRFPYLALRADALSIVVPDEEAELVDRDQSMGEYAEQRAIFLLADGEVEGSLSVRARIRLSDHLARVRGWSCLRDCTLRLRSDAQSSESTQTEPVVLVNMPSLIGVVEAGG